MLYLLTPPTSSFPRRIKRRVVKQFYLMSIQRFQKPAAPTVQAEAAATDGETEESKQLLTGESATE